MLGMARISCVDPEGALQDQATLTMSAIFYLTWFFQINLYHRSNKKTLPEWEGLLDLEVSSGFEPL